MMQEEETNEVEVSSEGVENVVDEVQTTEPVTESVEEEVKEEGRKTRKERFGKVTSAKMNKTITVLVERKIKHPIYGKFMKKSKKFLAHDEKEDAREGDVVKIMECRPLSKRKTWRLVEVLERAK